MSCFSGNRYCLTAIDRYSRWPEAFPMSNMEAKTATPALYYNGWITRFGYPQFIATDDYQGSDFRSHLIQSLVINFSIY